MRLQVKDFMSSPVATTVGSNRVSEVRNFMKQKGVHALPVIRYTKKLPEAEITIRGIVTATDLSDNINENSRVEEIMTPSLHIIHKHSSVQAAAKMMLKHKVHHLVVMDEGKITGMISSLDFVKLVSEHGLG